MKRRAHGMPAWALLSIAPVVGPAILAGTSSTASSVTVMCQKWQALRVSGPSAGQQYVIRNKPSIRNNDLGMCLSNWSHHPNFLVTRSPGTTYSPTVRAYPYIATGCFEGACTAAGKTYYMPQAGSLGKYTITWSTKQPLHSGVWNASLDLWFGPRRGVGEFEVMIWLKYSKGSWWARRYPSVWIDGAKWYVVPHATAPGRHYISFRRATPVTKASLRILPFAVAAEHRGALATWARLWCAQAGFEIWSGGKGLAITWFSVTH